MMNKPFVGNDLVRIGVWDLFDLPSPFFFSFLFFFFFFFVDILEVKYMEYACHLTFMNRKLALCQLSCSRSFLALWLAIVDVVGAFRDAGNPFVAESQTMPQSVCYCLKIKATIYIFFICKHPLSHSLCCTL